MSLLPNLQHSQLARHARHVALAFGLAFAGAPALAGLIGTTVTFDQLYPSKEHVPLTLGPVVVGDGIEFPSSIADFDWDIRERSIEFKRSFGCFDLPCKLAYDPSIFNGFRLAFSGPNLPEIVGVELLETIGFTSFGSNRITFDASRIYIEFGGIQETFDPGTVFGARIAVALAERVPEPGTSALLAIGLVTAAALRGRRRFGYQAVETPNNAACWVVEGGGRVRQRVS